MQSIEKKYSEVELAQVGIVQYLFNSPSAERLRVGRAVMHEAFGRYAAAAKLLAGSEARPNVSELKKTCGSQELIDVIGLECMPNPMEANGTLRRLFKTVYGDYFALRARKQEVMSPQDVAVMSETYAAMDSALGFGEVRDFFDELSDYQEDFSTNHGKVGVPSPFPQLDAYIRGIERKKIYTVAAFSNVGKSRFLY